MASVLPTKSFPVAPDGEIAASFEALNVRGDSLTIVRDVSEAPAFFSVEGRPVAEVPTSDGGEATVDFSTDPPRLFPPSRIRTDGSQVSKPAFARLVKLSRARE